MREISAGRNEDGQRLDRVLSKYLPLAGKSFLYRMLRKKNITLNDKKAEGNERLKTGDVIRIWMSEETIGGFSGTASAGNKPEGSRSVGHKPDGTGRTAPGKETGSLLKGMPAILYEDDDIIVLNKPAGMLSQKASPGDVSVNEYITAYLADKGEVTEESLRTFRPAVSNRLDRNTSGILLAGKSLSGLRALSLAMKDRSADKRYLALVHGSFRTAETVTGILEKDGNTNTVRIRNIRRYPYGELPVTESPKDSGGPLRAESVSGTGSFIRTDIRPLAEKDGVTLIELKLCTGRPHQLRAQMAALGHPIVGDPKYGRRNENDSPGRNGDARRQLLHAYRVTLPAEVFGPDAAAAKTIAAPLPDDFRRAMKGMEWEPGNPED